MKKERSKKKVISIIIGVIFLVLVLVDLLVSNYLVSFALKRTDPNNKKSVSPKSTISDTVRDTIENNTLKISENTQYWLETLSSESVEIQSDDGLTLKRGNSHKSRK